MNILYIRKMINPAKIDSIQKKIKEALSKIEKEENVKISFGNCTYNAAYFKSMMSVHTVESSKKIDKVYEVLSKRMGFTQNIIGLKFTGSTCGEVTITEIKTKNRKFPIIGVTNDNKSYKFTVEQVKGYMGGDKLINRSVNLDKLLGK
jgi:hypothetical protein